jgi:hypothetical protein
MSIGQLIPVGDKKLYMFSDIEGCQNDTKDQSSALCKPEFYTKIAEMLKDPNVHVAFLGDYFDQGMHTHSSITGLKMLLDNEEFGSRVYVILGNRDVNKLRFIFELTSMLKEPTDKWSQWTKYYSGLSSNKGVNLVKHILNTSMGASKMENEKMTGLYSFMPFEKIETATDEIALDYLMWAFNIHGEKPEDALDILAFFKKCKLAHVFEGKVLLAHGGGFDPEAFFDQNYVDGYTIGYGKHAVYLQRLEEFRRRLSGMEMKPPDLPSSRDGISVQGSVDVYNTLFQEVLSEIDDVIISKNFGQLGQSRKFILLQALGLKPDKEDARYKSLVQSCSQDGCSGKNPDLKYDPSSTKLKEVLSRSGITHVSYGHKPVCFPIPLIYQRSTIEGVTFISNDTSNGNRKTKNIGDNTVVGTSITFKSDRVETQVELITLDGKESPASMYSDMFGPFSLEIPPPEYIEEVGKETTLTYKGHKISFNNLLKPPASFGELRFDTIISPPAAAGGRRRSRNRKRNTKRVSRYTSKRTRRNKKTRRGRKIRKSSV